ncbi:MAG: SlyX family protein [Phycisphaerales bacterium]
MGADPIGRGDGVEARVVRLEEALAFADRHGEQLGEQLVQVWARVDALQSRIARMEARLGEIHQSLSERGGERGEGGDGGTADKGAGGADGGAPFEADRALRDERPPHWDGGGRRGS